MNSGSRFVFLLFLSLTFCMIVSLDAANIGSCIRNCAQCKNMFGPYFLGEKCADHCVKHKGKFIPDCEDEDSIGEFLQSLDDEY